MANGDDYAGQTGATVSDDEQRRRRDELIARAAIKPTIPQKEPALDQPNTTFRGSPGATPTNHPTKGPVDPYGQGDYPEHTAPARPQFPKLETSGARGSRPMRGDAGHGEISRYGDGGESESIASNALGHSGGYDVSSENSRLIRDAGGMSGATSTPRMPNLPSSSRPNIPTPRTSDVPSPDINANTPWTPPPSNGKRLLGLGGAPQSGQLLGLNRGVQPARPDVQPMRSDFPEKPLPAWEKILGIAAAPFAPGVTAAIFQGPRREASRQYESAAKDWTLGQEGQERQARIAETQARTKSLLNPPQKEGVTPEETTIEDLMTGNNGQPQINPDTGKPYTRLEAYRTVQQTKQGAAQGAKQPPFDAATLSQLNQMHTDRYQQLNPGKPLPGSLTLRPGATQVDYERIDKNLGAMESAQGTQAQREATNTARQQAEMDRQEARREKQSEKDLQSVYAYDPKSKQTILTTYGEATGAKMPGIRKVGQPDIEKDTQVIRQLGDAQMNFSSYKMSLLRMQGLSGYEIARVGDLIGDSKFKAHFLGLELPSDWANELRQNNDWTKLPPDAQEAVVQYLSARPAVISYLRALNPGTRLNDAMIQTEMRNVPSPTDPPNVQESKFKRLQRNMEQASKALPRIPGLDTPEDVRQKTEVLTPQAPNPQPAQPAKKSPRQALADWLNQKMGAQ